MVATGRDRLALCIVALFAAGCLFDHLTTTYGLHCPSFIETNPLVIELSELGAWHAIEALVVAAGVGLGLRCLGSMPVGSADLYMGMLTFTGLIRLFAGLQNLEIILRAMT